MPVDAQWPRLSRAACLRSRWLAQAATWKGPVAARALVFLARPVGARQPLCKIPTHVRLLGPPLARRRCVRPARTRSLMHRHGARDLGCSICGRSRPCCWEYPCRGFSSAVRSSRSTGRAAVYANVRHSTDGYDGRTMLGLAGPAPLSLSAFTARDVHVGMRAGGLCVVWSSATHGLAPDLDEAWLCRTWTRAGQPTPTPRYSVRKPVGVIFRIVRTWTPTPARPSIDAARLSV